MGEESSVENARWLNQNNRVMEKIGIEKIRCFHPLRFYVCWMVVLAWMTLRHGDLVHINLY